MSPEMTATIPTAAASTETGAPITASSKKTPIKTYYMARNRFWFMKRHAGWHYPLFLIVFFLSSFWLSTGIHLLYYKSPDAFRAYARGIRDGLRGPAPLPETL